MNTVVLMGRLTREPDLRYLQSGGNTAIARFSLAVDKQLSREKRQELESKGQQTADFINCVAWGRLGENVAKYTGKGLRVIVEGRIQTGSYEKDGRTVYTTDVVASNVEFIDWKDGGNSSKINSSQDYSSKENNFEPSDQDFDYGTDFNPADDSRIPF